MNTINPVPFDCKTEPFSRSGVYYSIGYYPSDYSGHGLGPGYYFCSHHERPVYGRAVFRLEPVGEGADQAVANSSAECFRFTRPGNAGEIRLSFTKEGVLMLDGEGLGLRMQVVIHPGTVAYREDEDQWVLNTPAAKRRFGLHLRAGRIRVDAPWRPDTCERIDLLCEGEDGAAWHASLEAFQSTWIKDPARPLPREVAREAQADAKRFLEAFECTDRLEEPYLTNWCRAAQVLWAGTVAPHGYLKRPTVLMSKFVMDRCWSWDHCFIAMALAGAHDELAWDQWHVPFDHQDAHGALPDAVNDGSMLFNYCKPPIHGWTLQEMRRLCCRPLTEAELSEVVERLSAQTRWFLDHRRRPGDALPFYLHGNDSGWDNATVFDQGVPLAAPDLAAFLIIQTEVLAECCRELGRTEASASWQTESHQLFDGLMELWDGTRFVPQRLTDEGGREPVDSKSLMPCLPILLGQRLPEDIRRPLAATIETHLTPHGLATELPDSSRFVRDGYWRGPAWAPSTYLIACGLRDAGESELAGRVAAAYGSTCANTGFYENFSVTDGEGLRDRGYTWTAAVAMLFHDPQWRTLKA